MSKDTLTESSPNPSAEVLAAPGVVKLDTPIKRGEQTISSVQLRRPRAGELRGIDIAALIRQLDYGALETLLPRISEPTLTKADVASLDPADLTALAGEVVLFFVPKTAVKELLSHAS